MPKRMIGPNRRSLTGKLPAKRRAPQVAHAQDSAHGAHVQFELRLERELYDRPRFDDHVVELAARPVTIGYRCPGGRWSMYTPSALVTFDANRPFPWGERQVLCEVKHRGEPREDLTSLRPRLAAARDRAGAQGIGVPIVAERSTDTPCPSTAKFLLQFDQHPRNETRRKRVLWKLKSAGGLLTMDHLLPCLAHTQAQYADGLPVIWQAPCDRALQADFREALGLETAVSLPDRVAYGPAKRWPRPGNTPHRRRLGLPAGGGTEGVIEIRTRRRCVDRRTRWRLISNTVAGP